MCDDGPFVEAGIYRVGGEVARIRHRQISGQALDWAAGGSVRSRPTFRVRINMIGTVEADDVDGWL